MSATLNLEIAGLAQGDLSRIARQRLELHQAVARLEAGHFFSLGDIYQLSHQLKGTAGTVGQHQIVKAATAIHEFVLSMDVDRFHQRISDLTGLMVDFDLAISNAVGGNTERRGPPSRIKHLPSP